MEPNEKQPTPYEELNHLIDKHDLRRKAIEGLCGALDAKRTRWDKVQKQLVVENDWPTRLWAAKKILALAGVRPKRRVIQRVTVIHEPWA